MTTSRMLPLVALFAAASAWGAPSDAARAYVDAQTEAAEALQAQLDESPIDDVAAVQGQLAAMYTLREQLHKVLSAPEVQALAVEDQRWVQKKVQAIEKRSGKQIVGHMEDLVDQWTWFRIDTFGEQSEYQGWYLIQHAERALDLQERVLDTLREMVPLGQTRPPRYAFLYDRIAMLKGDPQAYGTQGQCVSPGVWKPLPLLDPAGIGQRRMAAGLEPLEEQIANASRYCP